MRKLKTSDIPAFVRCVKKLGVKDKIQELSKAANSGKDVWDNGFDFIWYLLDVATEQAGENLLYEFFAGIFEMTAQEVADLDLSTLFSNLKQLAAENDLAAFFGAAAKLMKQS